MVCPVCGNKTELCNCISCGFDLSLWCEEYPTLSYIYNREPVADARKKLFVRANSSVKQTQELGMLYLEYENIKNHCAAQQRTIQDMTAELKQLRALAASERGTSEKMKTLQSENERLNILCKSQSNTISRMSEEMKQINDALSRELYKSE